VPILRAGDVAVVHHTATVAVASPVAGQTVDLGRVRLARVRVTDAADAAIPADRYSTDLDAGTLTWADPLDLTGYTGPYAIAHTIEDMALVTDAQISGQLTLNRPLTHTFPADTSRVSSALIIGDLVGRVTHVFEQATWTGVWQDSLIGSAPTAQYNDVLYPIAVTNRGALQERWRINFTSTTAFTVVGETVGQIATGTVNADLAPLNPATGVPYFTLLAAGWDGGWATGNQLRFNTLGANYPLWVARTIEQGPATGSADAFRLQIRGDVDA
jgi:hypothetical protein